MGKLCLLLAIHNHQPTGNFQDVIESAYQKAYLPFLKTLEKHPEIKLTLHYSGNLLLWLKKNHGDFLDLVRRLIRHERIELLSGGFYEPILPAIPDRDKIGQIKKLNDFIRKEFGYKVKGMWLAERVWEPALPRYIREAGIEYLPLDDYHLKLTGLMDKDLRGYFITEEEGYTVRVFPGSERLRYLIPFKDVAQVISYLREVSLDAELELTEVSPLICMADDGEKFGVWPGTHKHVYIDGWLDRFFTALNENSDWLETMTFSEYLSKNPPIGRIYLPTTSYREMGEWALLSSSEEGYKDAHTPLRGGFWRNFLSKYPEGNHIHKRMLQISKKVHEAVSRLQSGVKGQKSKTKKLTTHNLLDELWQGQCNDAYWHGIFGGIYLPHLRSSVYSHLLKAEALSGQVLSITPYSEEDDIDKDGFKDIFLSTSSLSLFFAQKGGSLCELSHKEKAVNVLDVLSRRYEPYHKKLSNSVTPLDVATIHERLDVKEPDIARHLIFDSYRKVSLIDHFIPADTTIDLFREGRYQELGDFIEMPYSMKLRKRKDSFIVEFSRDGRVSNLSLMLKKTVSVKKAQPQINISYDVRPLLKDAVFCIEFNLSFLGSPKPIIEANNRRWAINSTREENGLSSLNIRDAYLHLLMGFEFNEPINLWQSPIETVSSSESGIERIYQGTTFILFPRLEEKPFSFVVSFRNGNEKQEKGK
mgnify:CR=1 FL=1